MWVYKITNKVDGKAYIGITTCSIAKRWREHLCAARTGSPKLLYRAMRKHGTLGFKIEPLYEASSLQELKVVERGLIAQYGTHANGKRGYNLTSGGEGGDIVNQPCGEQLTVAILTEEVVRFIRDPEHATLANNVLLVRVLEKFSVVCSRDAIRDARRGDTWKHMNKEAPPQHPGQGGRKGPMSEETMTRYCERLAKYQKQAVCNSVRNRTGKRGANARLSEDTVKKIFYSPLSLNKTAAEFGVSKKMVLLVKQRKAHRYLTEELQHG